MWFEVAHRFMLVLIPMSLPPLGCVAFNYIILGKPYRRTVADDFNLMMYMRDERLSGHAYKHQGLNYLPDE